MAVTLQERGDQGPRRGHEVLLQIPLEPNNYPTEDPGPHTLLTTLPPDENMKRLQWLMSRYTGYVGVTNHMGAKFEAATDSFMPVLEEVKRRGLLYVDDGSRQGLDGRAATPGDRARIFRGQRADRRRLAAEIEKQLAKLETMAKQQGTAIGVVGQARRRQAARRLGRQARGQGPRAGAGQRRRALAAAKLIVLP